MAKLGAARETLRFHRSMDWGFLVAVSPYLLVAAYLVLKAPLYVQRPLAFGLLAIPFVLSIYAFAYAWPGMVRAIFDFQAGRQPLVERRTLSSVGRVVISCYRWQIGRYKYVEHQRWPRVVSVASAG